MNDELAYEYVVNELREHGPKPGLWAKAFAEANGNEAVAKAMYMRFRAAQVIEEWRRNEERRVQEIKNKERTERGSRAGDDFNEHPGDEKYAWIGWGVLTLIAIY
jgi:hypothetical protein